VAQLTSEKDLTVVVAMRELWNSVTALNEALGLSHVEKARLCTLGVELRGQVAALTSEKEQNLISWAREKRDRDSIIGALELQDASKATKLDAVKAELTRVRSELEAATTRSSARVSFSGQPSGMQVQPTQGDPAGKLSMDTPYVGGAPAESRREGELMGDTRGEDRAVGAGIMLTPSRLQSSPLGFQDQGQSSTQGLTALTQNVISGKVVHLIGARITPESAEESAAALRRHRHERNGHDRVEARNSKALATRPGPWRRTWDVEYFVIALEEIYAIDVVDKFADEPGIWRTLVESLKNIKVDPSKIEALSVDFTAVILQKDTKHKLPEASKARTLKDLARVFTISSNRHKLLDSNKAFSAELQEELAQETGYSEDPSLKVFLRVYERLILKWQMEHFDNLNRGKKRASAGGQVQGDEANRSKWTRAEQGAYATSDDNHCEGCGIPRHKRDQCQLFDHPDWNNQSRFINSSAFAAIKKAGSGW
jgi:hypothetical protein